MSTGVVGGDRYEKYIQYTYAEEIFSTGLLVEDCVNVFRVTGSFRFPTPTKIGGWLKLLVPKDLDTATTPVTVRPNVGNVVKLNGVSYSELGIKDSMKGTEIYAFVNADNIWEVV